MFYMCRYIQSTCATSGEGLYEGLDWLSNNIASKVNKEKIFSELNISNLNYRLTDFTSRL